MDTLSLVRFFLFHETSVNTDTITVKVIMTMQCLKKNKDHVHACITFILEMHPGFDHFCLLMHDVSGRFYFLITRNAFG